MKIFDAHIHMYDSGGSPEKIIDSMEKAEIYGGCIFSRAPYSEDGHEYIEFDRRMLEVLEFTRDYKDRLFPVMRIHPYEENIIENIHKAVENGIDAFKIICSDFYVYEEQVIRVLKEIAKLDKPVFFHSGILWSNTASSEYNRPLHWEKIKNIKGLRFSLAHCSWPWTDECIALYGEFLYSCAKSQTAEMFFDLTPGTPEVYREDMLRKLFFSGYDVGNNILWGTDTNSHNYNSNWAKSWLEIDNRIMDNLGISYATRENVYFKNLLRFLGKSKETICHSYPDCDNAKTYSPVNDEVPDIIRKWYKKLDFESIYDNQFEKLLNNIPISDAITIENYNINGNDSQRDLLSFLYMCEKLEKQYQAKGIDDKILCDTLKDLKVWANTWTDLNGVLSIGELEWLKNHLSMKLFKLGRLQFCMAKAESNISRVNISKGDNVVEIHIPEGERLTPEECMSSFSQAKVFFEKFFPEFEFEYFICDSWLLDKTLQKFLKPESNILKFQSLFNIASETESDSILKYVFKWNTTRHNLKYAVPYSDFSRYVKEYAMKGNRFYKVLGVISK